MTAGSDYGWLAASIPTAPPVNAARIRSQTLDHQVVKGARRVDSPARPRDRSHQYRTVLLQDAR